MREQQNAAAGDSKWFPPDPVKPFQSFPAVFCADRFKRTNKAGLIALMCFPLFLCCAGRPFAPRGKHSTEEDNDHNMLRDSGCCNRFHRWGDAVLNLRHGHMGTGQKTKKEKKTKKEVTLSGFLECSDSMFSAQLRYAPYETFYVGLGGGRRRCF